MKADRTSNERSTSRVLPVILGLLLMAGPLGASAQKRVTSFAPISTSFKHFAFSSGNGGPPDVRMIAQGGNGDLWLASASGLFLFDGLQFQRFQPVGPERLRSELIYSMFAHNRGRVWIGYYGGGASVVVDGHVRSFEEGLPKGPLKGFAEDPQGRIWALSVKGLSYFDGTHWHPVQTGLNAQDGTPYVMLSARDGTLWIATSSALLFIRPGKFVIKHTNVPTKEAWALAQGPDGRIWLSDEGHGTRPITTSPGEGAADRQTDAASHGLVARRLLFDRTGGLWMALQGQPGLVHVAHPDAVATGMAVSDREVTARYREKGGLTSDLVGALLEDRHGVVWAGTRLGIDRFSPASYRLQEDITTVPRSGFRAAQSAVGDLAIADDDTIYLYSPDEHLRSTVRAPGTIRGLCAGGAGQMFAVGDFGLSRIVPGGLEPRPFATGLTDPTLLGCQVDRAGRLWILTRQDGVMRLQGDTWTRLIPQQAIGAPSPRVMVLDGHDRLWLGSDHRGIALFVDGKLRHFDAGNGLDIGFVQSAQSLEDGVLLGGELGIAMFDKQRFRSLTNRDYPQFRVVSGIARDRQGDVWLNGSRGVTHLPGPDVQALFAGVGSERAPRYRLPAPEAPFYSQLNCCENTILFDASRHLWLLTAEGVAQLDPGQPRPTSAPPRPILRLVTSNGKMLAPSGMLTLARGHPDIAIDYTSDSIANAQHVQFRYRLTGGPDDGWIEAGSRRQASYTSIEDGIYRFEIQARDENGPWSGETAALAFTVPATFLQTPWPKLIGLIIAVALMMLIYRIRLGYAVEALRKRLEERTRERERIARALHDTLLQSVQGLILGIESAKQKIEADSLAFHKLETSLERAEDVFQETLRAVHGLRLWDDNPRLDHLLDRTVTRLGLEPRITVSVRVIGTIVPLDAEVGEEIERIIGEALTNVLRHSGATAVQISARFGRRALSIAVADNGHGMAPEVLALGHRAGHFGLVGMRERAKRLSGKLGIASSSGNGTEITLIVPGFVAFKSTTMWSWRLWSWRRKKPTSITAQSDLAS